MGYVKATLAACAIALAGPAFAQDVVLTGDVWSVCGLDGVLTWHDTRLVFTTQSDGAEGQDLAGYFDWRSSADHAGREHFVGVLRHDGTLALQGVSMDGGAGLVTSRYVGRLSDDGQAISDGIWLDGAPGVWAARQDGGCGTAVGLCEVAAQLS